MACCNMPKYAPHTSTHTHTTNGTWATAMKMKKKQQRQPQTLPSQPQPRQSWARAAATPTHHLATLERRRRRRQIASQPLFSYAKALTMIVINWEADSARRTLHTLQAPLQHCSTLPHVAACTVRRNGRCWRCSMSSVAIGRCFGFAFFTYCRGVYSLSPAVWWNRKKLIEGKIIEYITFTIWYSIYCIELFLILLSGLRELNNCLKFTFDILLFVKVCKTLSC